MDNQRWVRQKMVDQCDRKGLMEGPANRKLNLVHRCSISASATLLFSICRRIK